jgi:hypothetical protein
MSYTAALFDSLLRAQQADAAAADAARQPAPREASPVRSRAEIVRAVAMRQWSETIHVLKAPV